MPTTVPTLDARNTIPARLEKLEMPQWFFAELCGLNKAEFSRLMNGQKPLSGEQTEKFYAVLDKAEELTRLLEPCPIKWADVEVIRDVFSSRDLSEDLFVLLTVQGILYLQYAIEAQQNCDRMEAEIAAIQEKSRDAWLGFLQEVSPASEQK